MCNNDTMFEMTYAASDRLGEVLLAVHESAPHESARDSVREAFVAVASALDEEADWGASHDWYVAVDEAANLTCTSLRDYPDLPVNVRTIVALALAAAARS